MVDPALRGWFGGGMDTKHAWIIGSAIVLSTLIYCLFNQYEFYMDTQYGAFKLNKLTGTTTFIDTNSSRLVEPWVKD